LNKYETIIIINPNAETAIVDKIISDTQNIISGDESGGVITKTENWGRKKLAYEIKGNKEGLYILMDYETVPLQIQRLERYCKLSEQVIKYMTVRAEDLPEPRSKEITKPKFDEDEDFGAPRFKDYDDDNDDDYDDDDD
jgi:small subunit ribosomal protein S6